MSQTSDPGTTRAAAGESPTDEVAPRSTDDTQSGGAAGTRDAQASGTAREAAADDPEVAEADRRAPRAAEEVEQDDRAGADDGQDGSTTRTKADKDAGKDAGKDADTKADGKAEAEAEAERQKSAEEFAAEHDPAKHDVEAGEEFRQPGDWVADDESPQEWDSEGHLVSGSGSGTESGSATPEGGGGQPGGGDEPGGGGQPGSGASSRRVSELDEVRDGGYSVGSAAPIDDGAMPLGHPVKAWEDTKTYAAADHPRYEDAEPHLWFTDPGTAERAGFRRAD